MTSVLLIALTTAIVGPSAIGWGVLLGRRTTRGLQASLEREAALLADRALDVERAQEQQAAWRQAREVEIRADLLTRESALADARRALAERTRSVDAEIDERIHARMGRLETALADFRQKWVAWETSGVQELWRSTGYGDVSTLRNTLFASNMAIQDAYAKGPLRLSIQHGKWRWSPVLTAYKDWSCFWDNFGQVTFSNNADWSIIVERMTVRKTPPEVPSVVDLAEKEPAA